MKTVGIKGLFLREYLPYACWVGSYALLGLHLGHADAVRFLGCLVLLRAARAVFAVDVPGVLRNKLRTAAPHKDELKGAALAEALFFASTLGLLTIIILGLVALNERREAELLGVLTLSLPAAHLLFLSRSAYPRRVYRLMRSAALLLGLLMFWSVDRLSLFTAGAAYSLACWVALLPAFRTSDIPTAPAIETELTFDWKEAARRRGSKGYALLSYRIGKNLLSILFGPLGTLMVRTGRRKQLHVKAGTMLSVLSLSGIAAVTCVAAIGGAVFHGFAQEPSTFLISAALFRIAATAVNALWLNHIAPVAISPPASTSPAVSTHGQS